MIGGKAEKNGMGLAVIQGERTGETHPSAEPITELSLFCTLPAL